MLNRICTKILLLLIVLLLSTPDALSSSYNSSELDNYNYTTCHSCSNSAVKSAAIEKAKLIGFADYIEDANDDIPTRVFVFNYSDGSVKKFDVFKRLSLITFQNEIVELDAKANLISAYSDVKVQTDEFFDNPFTSNVSGYEFLQNSAVRQSVFNNITNSWYGILLGAGNMVQIIDDIVGLIPDDPFYERLQVKFSDDIVVNITIKGLQQVALNNILTVTLEYVADTAYLELANGTFVKIPDDVREASEPKTDQFDNQAQIDGYMGYMGAYGYAPGSGGGWQSGSGNSYSYCYQTSEVTEQGLKTTLHCKLIKN
ncbi:hypothetical protein [Paraglaciecola sp.]|uniref:hypothetical protein n=1 Tax=Paraglaciecola sp. TaxID=1920173 RepID=UPI0030F43ABD